MSRGTRTACALVMGKLAKKLIVYLDQNFISEMAKADHNHRVKPQFKQLYELLHEAFLNEKAVVPHCFFHDIESSLAAGLIERIRSYQGYLGQTSLLDRHEVQARQLQHAVERFVGVPITDFGFAQAFREDPDAHLERFAFRGGAAARLTDWAHVRSATAARLNALRDKLLAEGATYDSQLNSELEGQERVLLSRHGLWLRQRLQDQSPGYDAFVSSGAMRSMPSVSLYAQLWAKIAIDHPGRKVREGDATDIEVISTYLPYVDVFATDTFVSTISRGLDADATYKTRVFGANDRDLAEMLSYLRHTISSHLPVNKPALSIFVLSDEHIKENSWEFFRLLANSMKRCEARDRCWIELFGFDDGSMRSYFNSEVGVSLPFYGLQDVAPIILPVPFTTDDVLALCRQNTRADAFILIDSYLDPFPQSFVANAVSEAAAGASQYRGYGIGKAWVSVADGV